MTQESLAEQADAEIGHGKTFAALGSAISEVGRFNTSAFSKARVINSVVIQNIT